MLGLQVRTGYYGLLGRYASSNFATAVHNGTYGLKVGDAIPNGDYPQLTNSGAGITTDPEKSGIVCDIISLVGINHKWVIKY